MNTNKLFDMYGESHTRFIGMTFYRAKVGTKINLTKIYEQLTNRQGIELINTARKELEQITFLSGVENNIIIDEKISFVLENRNYRTRDYEFGIVRPSHIDLVGYQVEQHNFAFQGGGRFSGRLSALYVVLGEICRQSMNDKLPHLKVVGQIKQVGNLVDRDLPLKVNNCDLKLDPCFPVIDKKVKEAMLDHLRLVRKNGDSQGAKLEYAISGLPVGIGGMYQESFESILSQNIFAIGGIKGINFGLGNEYITSLGSEANDEYYVSGEEIKSDTNKQGGINGGFTNGIQDVRFNIIVRPTPTIFKTQNTIRLTENAWVNYQHQARGRHDTFIANRVQVVALHMVYVSIYQLLY